MMTKIDDENRVGEDLHDSDFWCDYLGVRILDPAGWARADLKRSWHELIDEREFRIRTGVSTIQILNGRLKEEIYGE